MIDSHAHIYAEQFADDIASVMDRAKQAGVSKILMPNIDLNSIDAMYEIAEAYPNYAIPMMGLHPCSVQADYSEVLTSIKAEFDKRPFIAVGEIGIDLYWDKTTQDIQTAAFLEQCRWAIDMDIPVVIHSRESTDLLIDLIEENFAGSLQGVFHCFTGTVQQAKRIIDLGMYVGLGGVLTFKNSGLKDVVPSIPLDRILLETDSPYLAPSPNRGKRNEPSYTSLVLAFLAETLGRTEEELDGIIEANTLRLFKI